MESNLVQNLVNLKSLPETWAVKDFKEVVSDNSGGNKKLAKSNFLKDGDIAVVDQGKKLIAGFYNDTSLAVKTQPPYVVFGDHTRAFKYVDFPFIMGADGTKVLQPKKDNCETKYLYYFFLSINVPNTGYNRHFKYLKELKIPLPSLDQQKKIAAILDAADAYRQKTKALIEKYDELTQSLFLNMFGDPVTNPKGWEFVLFKELIIKIENGWSPVCENFSRISNDDWAILKLGAVSKRFYDFSENKQLLPENKPKIELKVSEGDLLFVRKNTYEMVGASAYVFSSPGNLMIPDTIFRLKYIESKVNPIFLWLTINHENYRQEIQRLASGSAGSMPNISKSRLMNKKIYLPPVDKQNQFAERVQAIETQKAQAQASLAQAEDLFNSLLQKTFIGELTS